jgi:hypothetical protein
LTEICHLTFFCCRDNSIRCDNLNNSRYFKALFYTERQPQVTIISVCVCVSVKFQFTMAQKAASSFVSLSSPPAEQGSRYSSFGIVTRILTAHEGSWLDSRQARFSVLRSSQTDYGVHSAPFSMRTGRGRGFRRLRMSGAMPLFPHMPSWRTLGQLNFRHQ